MAEIQCLSPSFREELLEIVKRAGGSETSRKILAAVPDCQGDDYIQIGPACEPCGSPAKKEGRQKRAPSAYNIYIGDCMRGTNRPMKECAADYKRSKDVVQ